MTVLGIPSGGGGNDFGSENVTGTSSGGRGTMGGAYIRDYEANSNTAGKGLSPSSDDGFLGITSLNKGDWQEMASGGNTLADFLNSLQGKKYTRGL